MVERHRREWHDPTANLAIRLADRGGGNHFADNRPTESAIRGRIARHRVRIDPLRELHALLEQIQKGGR